MSILGRCLSFIFIVAAFACGQKQENHHHDHDADHASTKEWKEMDDFHMVMAEAFHPYKDSANLKPAKEKAAELAASAEAWKNSDFPAGVSEEELKDKLERLAELSREFSRDVTAEPDDAVAAKLTAVHDFFHEVQNDVYGGAADGHDHDGHEHH